MLQKCTNKCSFDDLQSEKMRISLCGVNYNLASYTWVVVAKQLIISKKGHLATDNDQVDGWLHLRNMEIGKEAYLF